MVDKAFFTGYTPIIIRSIDVKHQFPMSTSKIQPYTTTEILMCEFSSDVFGGFQVHVSPSNFESLNELINFCLSQLESYLRYGNLQSLIIRLQNQRSDFHVHNFAWEEILNNRTKRIYICDHVK